MGGTLSLGARAREVVTIVITIAVVYFFQHYICFYIYVSYIYLF